MVEWVGLNPPQDGGGGTLWRGSAGSSGIGYHCLALSSQAQDELKTAQSQIARISQGPSRAVAMKNLLGREVGHSLKARCLRSSLCKSSGSSQVTSARYSPSAGQAGRQALISQAGGEAGTFLTGYDAAHRSPVSSGVFQAYWKLPSQHHSDEPEFKSRLPWIL